MERNSDRSEALSSRAAVYGLSLLTLLNFVNYIDRSILSAVLASIRADFHLSHAQGGFIATAFLTAYFVTSPAFGRLGDRLSRTRLMALGVGVWSLATAGAGIGRGQCQQREQQPRQADDEEDRAPGVKRVLDFTAEQEADSHADRDGDVEDRERPAAPR